MLLLMHLNFGQSVIHRRLFTVVKKRQYRMNTKNNKKNPHLQRVISTCTSNDKSVDK